MDFYNSAKELVNYVDQTNAQIDSLLKTISDLQVQYNQDHEKQLAIIAKLNRQAIAQRVIGSAYTFDFQDIQYNFGGEWENDKAFDCSAFMQVIFKIGTEGKVLLPRTSHEQAQVGMAVPLDAIEVGDTLHYDFDGDGRVTHVGIAINSSWMIHTNNEANDINRIKIADYSRSKLVAVRRHIL